MASDSFDDKSGDFLENTDNQIDPRDTYGARYSVVSRRVAKTSDTPRSAISSGTRYLRNSNKIFTKHHDRDDLGGSVNMKNVNMSKPKQLVNKVTHEVEQVKMNIASKSSGLDSLFESTSENVKDNIDQSNVSNVEKVNKQNNSEAKTDIYKPKGKNRPLKIIKPISYNSAKEISTALKAGSAVVLCLKTINEENAKRLLDFSFGAAAMCGAHVSLAAEKTFVITIGSGLSKREKLLCIKEGIALKVEE